MSYQIIRKNEQKVNVWSGGTTTQLAIYPENAEYKNRNFIWRLSSAEINEEESEFTSLSGFKRIIMIIKGKIKLEHKGHHEIYLNPFEQDTFMGDWETKSYGKARDFNLMLAKNCEGEINKTIIDINEKKEILTKNNNEFKKFSEYTQAFYCVNGKAKIYLSDNKIETLNKGDILLNKPSKNIERKIILENISNEKVNFINSEIWH